MVPDNVRDEFRSPILVAIVMIIGAIGLLGITLGRPLIVVPAISLAISLYLVYLFIRLVLAAEEIGYDQ